MVLRESVYSVSYARSSALDNRVRPQAKTILQPVSLGAISQLYAATAPAAADLNGKVSVTLPVPQVSESPIDRN
jgi:hypothetical protein